MEWSQLLSPKRYDAEQPEQPENGRSPFEKDIDKIIFSNAFRRLNHKTQVHPLPDNDHIHTRLTHSLEVSCVGRSLGTKVGERLRDELKSISIEPSDIGAIVQAACLAHDIGNPPFGHSGEEAIRHWFEEDCEEKLLSDLSQQECNDFIHFEGNAQGFRIVTQLEYDLFSGGMRLTYATLGVFLKYPWTSDMISKKEKKKYGCNQSEKGILKNIANQLGLVPQEPETDWCRHPLSYLMEAADDICYALIDLEDGLEMDFLRYDEIEKIFLNNNVVNSDEILPSFHEFEENDSDRRKIAILRGKAMDVLVNGIVDTFIEYQNSLLQGVFDHKDLIHACGGSIKNCISDAKKIAREKIFNNPRKLQLEIGAYATIEILLTSFLGAAYNLHKSPDGYKSLSFKDQKILGLMGSSQPKKKNGIYTNHIWAFSRGL